jgi:hypothetical protein
MTPDAVKCLAEGLVFLRGSSDAVQGCPEDSEFQQTMKDISHIHEYNCYQRYVDDEMAKLDERYHQCLQNGDRREMIRVCGMKQNLSVMNLEMFRMVQERHELQSWLKADANVRSAMWSKVNAQVVILDAHIKRLTEEKKLDKPVVSAADLLLRENQLANARRDMALKSMSETKIQEELKRLRDMHAKEDLKRVPFQYQDVLVQVQFDGFSDANKCTALCVFPTDKSVGDVIKWLFHSVFDMSLLQPFSDTTLPFVLNRNGVLEPERAISSVCSPPTSTIVCRVNVRDSALRELPFRVDIKEAVYLNGFISKLFPTKKITEAEVDRVAQVKQDLEKDKDNAVFLAHLQNHPSFKLAEEVNKRPVSWRFSRADGRLESGQETCDSLRVYLNQGHFDDPAEYGKILKIYEFSFRDSHWQSFTEYSAFLKHINDESITRTFDAIRHTLQATIAAALQTFKEPASALGKEVVFSSQRRGNLGSMMFTLPSLQQVDMQEEQKALIFTDSLAFVDKQRTKKDLPLLFSDAGVTCHVTHNPSFLVEFLFPCFLSFDMISRERKGLQLALEDLIFNFYFKQKLSQPNRLLGSNE